MHELLSPCKTKKVAQIKVRCYQQIEQMQYYITSSLHIIFICNSQ